MIRDPLYRSIVEGLEGHLDPEVFERCAQDLLHDDYRTLVPVRGGNDGGMDGAVADGKGLAFPLVCTTGKDVKRNLETSLRSYRRRGGKRRRIIMATSRLLNATKRVELEEAAAALGFSIVQIHDQAAMANLLYRHHEWCKELLDLTGAPPPLSVLPTTKRWLGDQPLIGREMDLKWLKETKEDVVLSGQPGSGKTFLMYILAREDSALFVVSSDRTTIANGIRSQRPKALLIDDAHLHPELLLSLRQLRQEIQGDFRIIANCWPGQEDTVRTQLDAPSSAVRMLERLSQDEILAVIKACGIGGPRELLHHLVRQAEGLPGLAVTLARLILRGDGKEVALGDALARDVRTTFQGLVGEQATEVLASFALGGNAGMTMEAVGKFLGLSRADVHVITSQLAAGGVLHERQNSLSVRPPVLRFALVRDVFFTGAKSLPIDELLPQVKSLPDAICTLIGAKHRNAQIADSYLHQLLEQTPGGKPWFEFAWLGREQCKWVLENHPDMALAIIEPALEHCPESIIPHLLASAVGDDRPLNSHPDHTLRQLEDWVEQAKPDTKEIMERRTTLMESALKWNEAGGDDAVTLSALAHSLSPGYNFSHSDPGSGRTFTFGNGCVSAKDIKNIHGNWARILAFLQKKQPQNWNPILTIVRSYIHRHHAISNSTREASAALTQIGWKMLESLVKIASDHPGVIHWAICTGKSIKRKVSAKLDTEFEVLFPTSENRIPSETLAGQEANAARELGIEWAKQKPALVADKYASFLREAERYNCWPRYGEVAFTEIAKLTQQPGAWLKELRAKGAGRDLALPFLKRSIELGEEGAMQVLVDCLQGAERHAALLIILTMEKPDTTLLETALTNLQGMERTIEFWVMKKLIPEHQLRLLLAHSDDDIASSAALAEWHAHSPHVIRPSLEAEWKTAIIRSSGRHHQLHDIFTDRPDIAQAWLERLLGLVGQGQYPEYSERDTARDARIAISLEQREHMLRTIPAACWWDEILSDFVGRDPALYKIVLDNPEFERLRLAPLRGHPGGTWVKMAKMALDAGCNPEWVVGSTRLGGINWSGEESDMWQGWLEDFDKLRSHPDPAIKKLGEIGYKDVKANQDDALKREHHEKVYGL